MTECGGTRVGRTAENENVPRGENVAGWEGEGARGQVGRHAPNLSHAKTSSKCHSRTLRESIHQAMLSHTGNLSTMASR